MKPDVKFLDTFEQGLRRDSVNPETSDRALYEMKNYALNYEGGKARLEVRKGSKRWNTFILGDKCKQLFHFIDLELHELIIGVLDDRWYVLSESGNHEMIVDEAVTVPTGTANIKNAPIEMFGNRVVFCTDTNMYWSDYDSLNTATPDAYHLGIIAPTESATLTEAPVFGNQPIPIPGSIINKELDPTTHRKIAFKIVLSDSLVFNIVNLRLQRSAHAVSEAHIRVAVFTNNAGKPSSTLADPYSISNWMSSEMVSVNPGFTPFVMADTITLSAGTYWIVLEGDTEYYTLYNVGSLPDFWVSAFVFAETNPTNFNVFFYDQGTSTWGELTDRVGYFNFGGLVTDTIYDYVYTFYNSIYGIESRPSQYIRLKSTSDISGIRITPPNDLNHDPQIDKIRIYRRYLDKGLDILANPDSITTEYQLVKEIAYGGTWLDSLSQSGLGAILQTEDHYCYDEVGKSDSATRATFLPVVISDWKGRLWTVEANKNIIIFSKKLEQDGATGLTGTPIPDFFPPETRIEMPMPSSIIAIKPLANDQLAIYFRNVSIWLLWGMDAPLNPPADYRFIEPVTENGLIASTALTSVKSRHIYLSRNGVYAFQGQANPEHLSEPIASIIRALPDSYVAKSVITSFGEEIWLMLDTDGDGYGDEIYILDLQKSIPAWRMYDYGIKIGDLVVRNSGTEYQSILAADIDNEQIVQLEIGTDDDDQLIEAVLETHDIRVGTSGTVTGLELLGHYPDNPPAYDVKVIEFDGTEHNFGMKPVSSRDKRGHRYGLRANSFGALKVRITQLAKTGNQLLGYLINFNRK